MKISELLPSYLQFIRYRLKSYRDRKRILERFAERFPDYKLKEITKPLLLAYMNQEREKGAQASTITQRLLNLSAFYTYLQKYNGLKLENPIKGLPHTASQKRVRYIETQEAEKLIETAKMMRNVALADFIELGLNTGCRKTELLTLKFPDIDFSRRILRINAEVSKNGKPRYIPLNGRAKEVLERRKKEKEQANIQTQWVFFKRTGERYQRLDDQFNKAVKRAGIQDFHIHDLRHTFASWLVSEGVELEKIRDLLGHSSITMTERYAHLAPNRLHDAVKVLDNLKISLLNYLRSSNATEHSRFSR
jgi:site-specific recombinase XerD